MTDGALLLPYRMKERLGAAAEGGGNDVYFLPVTICEPIIAFQLQRYNHFERDGRKTQHATTEHPRESYCPWQLLPGFALLAVSRMHPPTYLKYRTIEVR